MTFKSTKPEGNSAISNSSFDNDVITRKTFPILADWKLDEVDFASYEGIGLKNA